MESTVPDFVLFLGRFHPLVVHLPIGFLFFSFILEMTGRFTKNKNISSAIPIALLSASISALLACILGYMLSLSGDYEESMLNTHFWLGIGTTIITFIAWHISSGRFKSHRLNKLKPHTSTLALSLILVSVTGHYGGNLTHGSDYLLKYAPFSKNERVELKPVSNVKEAAIYDYLVAPIFENKCSSCHNPSKKKGGLSLIDTTSIKKGGKNGEVIVAGQLSKSELMHRILMDSKDEDFMPPEGKTPLTDEEITILSYWIENGNSDFQTKIGEIETPTEVISIASKMLGIKDITGRSEVALPQVSKPNKEVIDEIAAEGFKVRELVFESNLYEIVLQSTSIPNGTTAELGPKLKKLQLIKENILWLSLNGNSIEDEYLDGFAQFTNLQKLDLGNNPITDIGVSKLTTLSNLRGLNLYKTKITAKSLDYFSQMENLRRAYVWGTAISKNNVEKLKSNEKTANLVIGL